MFNRRIPWSFGLWLFVVYPAYAAPCPDKIGTYAGYHIQHIRVTSPVGFFAAAKAGFNDLAEELPLKRNGDFDVTKFNEGTSQITTRVRTGFTDGFSAMRFVATSGEIEDCDAANRTLSVHYIVYTTVLPPLLGHSFEEHQAETSRPGTTGALLGSSGRFLTVPKFGYNHARKGYGGMTFRSDASLLVWDQAEADVEASSESLVGNFALTGKRTTGMRYLNDARWRLDAFYHDVPAGPQELHEAGLAGSFFGSSKSLSEGGGLVLHYGVAVMGGHQQSALHNTTNSSFGDVKLLIDANRRSGPSAVMAAYGLQIASTLNNRTVDFIKHVVDLSYAVTVTPLPKFLKNPREKDDRPDFIGRPHRPLSIESRLTAGIIQNLGQVPAIERFYGGNQSTSFINGQPWDVRGQAYIRGIPENRLGSSGQGFGGTRFYSLNLTFAKAVAGRAILPTDLGTAEFVHNLDFAINTAKGELSDTYLGKETSLTAAAPLDAIQAAAGKLKDDLGRLTLGRELSMRLAPTIKNANGDIDRTLRTVGTIRNGGSSSAAILVNTILPRLEQNLTKIETALLTSNATTAAAIADHRNALEDGRLLLQNAFSGPSFDDARKRADMRAENDLSVAQRVLNTFLYQLNAYSIAPVGIFDVARVWPTGVGTRYAAGGGVRLSVVNVNFTLGYAANPLHRAGEDPGALFFKLDVSDLFR